MTISRVLIANRGEISVRIIRALRLLGIESVAVYSDADASSAHRMMADYSIRLAGNTSAETYLNIPAILAACRVAECDAVHPGYGFLSENEKFCGAVVDAGLTFIGPSPDAMALMGDKVRAKKLMKAHGVPTTPGSDGALANLDELKKICHEVGYPMILKASAGGGGKGMQVISCEADIEPAYEKAKREAQSYFGNDAIFVEKFIAKSRHIEFQVICDGFGNGVSLFERDCSIQRRHQKLIEEAPSTYLSHEQREKIGGLAVKAAIAAGYEGVGTVEFICESPEHIYFMEMNTRIQVEHPVTEMVTATDLIAEQIRIASGQALSFKQEDVGLHGAAIEVRVNCEDPKAGFVPSVGTIKNLKLPAGPFVRVDTHIYEGYQVPEFYDSMVAKIIVWGRNREEALQRMQVALRELRIEGVSTTKPLHLAVLQHPKFREGVFTTDFLPENMEDLQRNMTCAVAFPQAAMVAACARELELSGDCHHRPAVDQQREVRFDRRAWESASRF